VREGSSNTCLDIEISHELGANNTMSELTLGSIPNLDVTVTAARHEFVRSAVVVYTEHITGMPFQNFGGQSLPDSSVRRSRVRGEDRRCTVSTVHIRIVVSSDAEARKTLSDDQATSDRPFECPVKFLTSCPVCGDQIFTSLSPAGSQVHENRSLLKFSHLGIERIRRTRTT